MSILNTKLFAEMIFHTRFQLRHTAKKTFVEFVIILLQNYF